MQTIKHTLYILTGTVRRTREETHLYSRSTNRWCCIAIVYVLLDCTVACLFLSILTRIAIQSESCSCFGSEWKIEAHILHTGALSSRESEVQCNKCICLVLPSGKALPTLLGNVVNHAVCDWYSVPTSRGQHCVGDDIHTQNELWSRI